MSFRSLMTLARATLVACGLTVAAGAAQAVPVGSPNGEPFPNGTFVTMTPGFNAPPFGFVPFIALSNFSQTSFSPAGGNQEFVFSATFSNDFLDAPNGNVVGSFTGTTTNFAVTILNRTSLFSTGTFNALITAATFDGIVTPAGGGSPVPLQTSIATNAMGTVTYTGNIVDGLFVQTLFTVPGQYSTDGGATNNPVGDLAATSSTTPTPPAPVPAPAGLGLFGLALAGLAVARRRGA